MRAAHRRAQAALTDSEKRFRQIAENIRDVFFLLDAGGTRMLYISPAYEEIYGRSCESVYANPESWIEAIHPDDRAATDEKYKKGMLAGNAEFEYRIVRPDGSIRWIKLRGFPVRDDAANLVRITGVAEDITERKRAGQELRESERRFSDMLGNVALVSVMVDREERITYCNEYLLRLTGWRQEEVIGRTWSELFVPPEINDRKDAFAALLANRPEARHRENEILTRSGERRLIRWNNSLLRSGAGDVIGTASIGEDITEQKRAEAWLHKPSHAVEQSPAATAITDTHGRFEYGNSKFLEVTGYTQEELIGKTPAVIKSGLTLPDVYEDLWRTILSGMEWRREIQNRRKNGELYWEYEIIS